MLNFKHFWIRKCTLKQNAKKQYAQGKHVFAKETCHSQRMDDSLGKNICCVYGI